MLSTRWTLSRTYWLGAVVLLGYSLLGVPFAMGACIALCAVQLAHFRWLEGCWRAFPVQIRLAYLLMLVAGVYPPLRFLHGVQFIGTTALILAGYCLLARLLSLAPWNRDEPLTGRLIAQALFGASAADRAGGCTC